MLLKLLILLLPFPAAYAAKSTPAPKMPQSQNFEVFTKKRSFQITGQLSPFRFLVDGRLLYERPRSFSSLRVNNVAVTIREDNRRYFEFETDADKFALEAKTWSGLADRFKLEPGRLISARWTGKKFLFTVGGEVAQAKIDGQIVSLTKEKIEWSPGDNVQTTHHLVLIGEGAVPSVTIEFQLVSGEQHALLTASKQSEEHSNKNRLTASVQESWLDKVQWRLLQVEGGTRTAGGRSNETFGLLLAPQYPFNKTLGLRGLLGISLFNAVGGLQWGPHLGLHLTCLLSIASLSIEAGPSLVNLNHNVGNVVSMDAALSFPLSTVVSFIDHAGLSYSSWLTSKTTVVKLFIAAKF